MMAHSYTPGLKVLHSSVVEKVRRLPIKGKVVKSIGDKLLPDEVVATTDLPGNVRIIKVASILSIGPLDIFDSLKVKIGEKVKKGDLIAQTEGIFGFFKSEVFSPIDGSIESISDVTGQLILREKPIPVEVDAYMSGIVKNIIPDEGVTIQTNAAFIQGIFGIGGEARGDIKVLVKNREEELSSELINETHQGKIIVGGSFISLNTFKKAMSLKVAGVVVGGFNYYDLEEILGYTLGVAITGSEEIETSLIVTEGYGNIKMSKRTFDLLSDYNKKFASINGATQIRAGVIRPEIVIPLKEKNLKKDPFSSTSKGIQKGSLVRVIRAPHFGSMGKVVELPPELQKMESETMVRVAIIKIDNEKLIIPRSNLEMVEID
jgi:transcription antitermination factor NusG